jgi:general secretion pathway protein E
MGTMKLEQLVLERGLVAPETLGRARLVQAETGERLDSVLTRLGMVAEQALANAIAKETGLAIAASTDFPAEPVLAEAISVRFLRDVRAVPIAESDGAVDVALIDPLDPYPIRALSFALDRKIRPIVAKANDLESALDRLYGAAAQAQADAESVDESDVERLKDLASDAPVVRTVNNLIARASEARASDIHIEPAEDCVRVRFRVDGALIDVETLPAQMKLPLISRIKVMASCASRCVATKSTFVSRPLQRSTARALCFVFSTAPICLSTSRRSVLKTTCLSSFCMCSSNPMALSW